MVFRERVLEYDRNPGQVDRQTKREREGQEKGTRRGGEGVKGQKVGEWERE